jgi:hypothetical protein
MLDAQGGSLAGVTITLSGVGHPLTTVSDSRGNFRYNNVDPGVYFLEAQLEGYDTLNFPDVDIEAQRTTSLEFTMTPAAQE